MNPLKRKKLYRLELSKQKQNPVMVEIELKKVTEDVVKPAEVLQQTAAVETANLDMGLKLTEEILEPAPAELSIDTKKEKKKKYSSQD